MKYSRRRDRYCSDVLNSNFQEIDERLKQLEQNGLPIVIGDTEPTENNVLWFNTSATAGENVVLLNLADVATSNVFVNVSDTDYGVSNVSDNEEDKYSYKVL